MSAQPPAANDEARLDALRREIREIDEQLVDLVDRRTRAAKDIGGIKQRLGLPIRNFAVEAALLAETRALCDARGIPRDVGEEMVRILIREAIRVQEQDRVLGARRFTDGRALVVGGRGEMGSWFLRYLDGMGYRVATFDPKGAVAGVASVDDLEAAAPDYDVIVLATPPSAVAGLLDRLRGSTRGVVLEIASLKTPFLQALKSSLAEGMRVASIHPMWGPHTNLLAGKNLVICDAGDADANEVARGLFAETAVNVVTIPVDEHDARMASTLGLPHALNLVFTTALGAAPYFPYEDLKHLGGPTFVKQVRVAHEVASENKDLYLQIQRLNAHTPEVYASIRRALDDLEAAVYAKQGPDAFRAYMERCRAYYGTEEIP